MPGSTPLLVSAFTPHLTLSTLLLYTLAALGSTGCVASIWKKSHLYLWLL